MTHLNADILAVINSGAALFPRVGERNAPILGGNALPRSNPTAGGSSPFTSFDNFVNRQYAARGFGTGDTPGNPYALAISNNITGRTDSSVFNFSESRITFFDNSQLIISDKGAMRLAASIKVKVG